MYRCEKCDVLHTIGSLFEHQARLDKVLSKFKKYGKYDVCKGTHYYYIGKTGITIDYNELKFYLEDNDLHSVLISLETVESLLKDLEEQDV